MDYQQNILDKIQHMVDTVKECSISDYNENDNEDFDFEYTTVQMKIMNTI